MEHAVVIFTKMKRRPKCFKQNVFSQIVHLIAICLRSKIWWAISNEVQVKFYYFTLLTEIYRKFQQGRLETCH